MYFTLHRFKWISVVILRLINLTMALDELENNKTFTASFQEDGTWSTDQWMRFNGILGGIEKEFTVCHWEKIRYFSSDISSIWAYCYVKHSSEASLKCWQF